MCNILIHVTLQDSIKGSQEPHETVSVNCRNFELRLSDNIRGTWLTLKQGSLTEVVAGSIFFDLGRGRSCLENFGRHSLATNDNEEVVAFITLRDDLRSCRESLLLDRVGHLASLVVIDAL